MQWVFFFLLRYFPDSVRLLKHCICHFLVPRRLISSVPFTRVFKLPQLPVNFNPPSVSAQVRETNGLSVVFATVIDGTLGESLRATLLFFLLAILWLYFNSTQFWSGAGLTWNAYYASLSKEGLAVCAGNPAPTANWDFITPGSTHYCIVFYNPGGILEDSSWMLHVVGLLLTKYTKIPLINIK